MSRKRGFGSIRKLRSGRYQARYGGPGGATVTAPHTFATKVAAEMWRGLALREEGEGK
jgi:hypothetical protein